MDSASCPLSSAMNAPKKYGSTRIEERTRIRSCEASLPRNPFSFEDGLGPETAKPASGGPYSPA